MGERAKRRTCRELLIFAKKFVQNIAQITRIWERFF